MENIFFERIFLKLGTDIFLSKSDEKTIEILLKLFSKDTCQGKSQVKLIKKP